MALRKKQKGGALNTSTYNKSNSFSALSLYDSPKKKPVV